MKNCNPNHCPGIRQAGESIIKLELKNKEYLRLLKECINGSKIYMSDIDHAVFFRGAQEVLLKYGDL